MDEMDMLEIKRENYKKYGSVYRPEGGIIPKSDKRFNARARAVMELFALSSTVR